MRHYKVCKYNLNGDYKNDWTCISDFNLEITKSRSIPDEYLSVELRYLNFAESFLGLFTGSFLVDIVEDHRKFSEMRERDALYGMGLPSLRPDTSGFYEGKLIGLDDALLLLQYSLRGIIWVRLCCKNGSYIAVGHDYYWLIGLDGVDFGPVARSTDLYVYEHNDPWE
jgi:hypothetical protein